MDPIIICSAIFAASAIFAVIAAYYFGKSSRYTTTVEVNGVEMSSQKKEDGRVVLVRGEASGVFCGNIVSREGDEVTLENSRRIWYWSGAASLSELAQRGTSKPSECKFPVAVNKEIILDAVEIIDVTPEAKASIDAVPVWSA